MQPQSVLDPVSPQAGDIALLWWIMLAFGTAIVVAVLGMLAVAVARARRGHGERPLSETQSRTLVLTGGVGVPLVLLLGLLVASVQLSAPVTAIPTDALAVEVIGRQWWWEIHYHDREGQRIATTANEIRVPVGQPVRFTLRSADVIHSFWVPNLQGKTDMIPGHANTSWFEAAAPGVFRGQCAEFCGVQHARMALVVVAESAADFAAWLDGQGAPAAAPATTRRQRGEEVFFAAGCDECHAVRGTPATAVTGPDLTRVGSRLTLAAGTLPNTRGNLAGWILDPQIVKPGSGMPATDLAPDDLTALLDYLEGLR